MFAEWRIRRVDLDYHLDVARTGLSPGRAQEPKRLAAADLDIATISVGAGP